MTPWGIAQEVGGWRRALVLGVLALGALTVLGRAFDLQVRQREFLTQEGNKRAIRTLTVQAHRGAIRDRNGQPLALSAPVESVWVVPAALLDAPDYIAPLAKLVDMKPRALERFLKERRDRQFVYLKRQMNPADATRILALKAPGVFSNRDYRRFYPAGEVVGPLVGFCDIDGAGQEGMEAARDRTLRGNAGTRTVIRDGSGHVIEDDLEHRAALPGRDLTLSIDLRLQYLAYRELKQAVTRQRAKGGLVVIADARSGEILAIANQPSFNPNRSDERSSGGVRNRAATDLFEPGSGIKPFLVAQALESHAYTTRSVIDTTGGLMKVGRLTVKDVHPYGSVDLARLLSKSSNVGAAMIGLKLGPEVVHGGYRRFGMGEPLASGFPGEVLGVLRGWQSWGDIATATAAYGYGLSVTALHLVRGYTALANDGVMVPLKFDVGAAAGAAERVVAPEVAREVRRLMEQVVSPDGTGSRAAVAGYRVAGKTGTVRKSRRGGYHENRHESLFIGMIPAEQPRLVGLVMINEPGAGVYYGGQVAAPVFASIMEGAARLLQLPPDGKAPSAMPAAPDFADEPDEPPLHEAGADDGLPPTPQRTAAAAAEPGT